MIPPIWSSFASNDDKQSFEKCSKLKDDITHFKEMHENAFLEINSDEKKIEIENLKLILINTRLEREKAEHLYQKLVDEKNIVKKQQKITNVCGIEGFNITTYSGYTSYV